MESRFFSWNFEWFGTMCVKRIFWNFWQHKVQFLLEANEMLSYLGFDRIINGRSTWTEIFLLLFKPWDMINILLTSFFSVRTVSYELVFSFGFMAQVVREKSSVRNLQYSSRTRLVRGTIWRMCSFFLSYKYMYISAHNNLQFFFSSFHVSFLHHDPRTLLKLRGPFINHVSCPFCKFVSYFESK